MDGYIFLFLLVIIVFSILSFVLSNPNLLIFILFFYLVRRLLAPRRRVRHYYYYTTDNDDTRNENRNTQSTQNTRNTTESIGHNTRADVRPLKKGAIDVEYTEVEEEDLPE